MLQRKEQLLLKERGLKSKTKKSVHNDMGEQVRSCVVVSSRERDEAGRFERRVESSRNAKVNEEKGVL